MAQVVNHFPYSDTLPSPYMSMNSGNYMGQQIPYIITPPGFEDKMDVLYSRNAEPNRFYQANRPYFDTATGKWINDFSNRIQLFDNSGYISLIGVIWNIDENGKRQISQTSFANTWYYNIRAQGSTEVMEIQKTLQFNERFKFDNFIIDNHGIVETISFTDQLKLGSEKFKTIFYSA